MNLRDKLKEQKKRLQGWLDLSPDVTSARRDWLVDLCFTTSIMLKENPTITTLKILQNINSLYYHMLKRTLANFYYYVRHITTLLSGVRKSRMRPCGNDSVGLGR